MGGASFGKDSLPEDTAFVGPLLQPAPTIAQPFPPLFQTRLFIPVELRVGPELTVRTAALVDTGCESNLVRRGLVPAHFFHKASRPIKFVAVNKTVVTGGRQELCAQLGFEGVDIDTEMITPLELTFICLEADIGGGDVIISYKWLA